MKNIFKKLVIAILRIEARIVLRKYKPFTIGIAGSVGKTSTKDAVYTALSPFGKVRKSQKSFNSEFGVPLTVLDLPSGYNNPIEWIRIMWSGLTKCVFKSDYPEVLLLEIGSDRPGDVGDIMKWLKLDIAILTRCPEVPVHVEFFDSPHELNEEDKKIVKGLKKNGVAILNADDPEIMNLTKRIEGKKIITYGFSLDADIKSSDNPFELVGVVGQHHQYPLLAALAVAEARNLNRLEVSEALRHHKSPPGRMKLIDGIHGSQIIDDTYNSSPIALEEALLTMKGIKSNHRKVAVLGDMLELGKHTIREHVRLGVLAKDCVDVLVTVGMRAEDFAKGAREAKMHHGKIHSFRNMTDAQNYLQKHIHAHDMILVKGSQGARMENIVKSIMKHPEQSDSLLVRQEEIWKTN